jgi:hypothetical protein
MEVTISVIACSSNIFCKEKEKTIIRASNAKEPAIIMIFLLLIFADILATTNPITEPVLIGRRGNTIESMMYMITEKAFMLSDLMQ